MTVRRQDDLSAGAGRVSARGRMGRRRRTPAAPQVWRMGAHGALSAHRRRPQRQWLRWRRGVAGRAPRVECRSPSANPVGRRQRSCDAGRAVRWLRKRSLRAKAPRAPKGAARLDDRYGWVPRSGRAHALEGIETTSPGARRFFERSGLLFDSGHPRGTQRTSVRGMGARLPRGGRALRRSRSPGDARAPMDATAIGGVSRRCSPRDRRTPGDDGGPP